MEERKPWHDGSKDYVQKIKRCGRGTRSQKKRVMRNYAGVIRECSMGLLQEVQYYRIRLSYLIAKLCCRRKSRHFGAHA